MSFLLISVGGSLLAVLSSSVKKTVKENHENKFKISIRGQGINTNAVGPPSPLRKKRDQFLEIKTVMRGPRIWK